MKIRLILMMLLSVVLLSCQSIGVKSNKMDDLTKMTDDPVIEQQLPTFETQVLKNGAQILWMKDDKLPSLAIKILIKSGTKDEPQGKSGVYNLMARLIDKGTSHQSAEQIAEFFESQGALFGAQVDNDYSMVGIDALSTNQDLVIPSFLDVVFAPEFPEAEYQREKAKLISELRRLPDDAERFAEATFEKFLYPGTPYSQLMDDLAALTRQDAQQAYKKMFEGKLITVGVTGQWSEKSKNLIVGALEKLPAGEAIDPKPIHFPTFKGRKIRLIVKDDLKQTQVRIGGLGIQRNDPDFLALALGSSALGGGSFTSRLFQEIRVKRGLTYNIHGNFEARLTTGSYEISTFTRHEKIHEIIEQTLFQLKQFKDKGISPEELRGNRASLTGLIAMQTETTNDVMKRLLMMRALNVPDSYLIDFNKNIRALELSQVNALIKKKFPSENLKILVYAPKKEGLEQLKSFGSVEVIDYKDALKSR